MYFYKMKTFKNLLVTGSGNNPMATDIFFEPNGQQKPVLIYAHGFNGFKDWGSFDLIAKEFARAGFVVVKFNFSHNGTTPAHPEEFVELDLFGRNNYSIQLADLGYIIDWVCDDNNPYFNDLDNTRIFLLGHSMGGGIAIIKASEDRRIKKLVSWASISECTTPWGNWSEEKMADWKESGVAYYTNTRTKQEMPLYYQLFEDYKHNQERLSIQTAISNLPIPMLICHGTQDASVPVQNAHLLKNWHPAAQIFFVESDHVFGRKHPWIETTLPAPMKRVVTETIHFLKRE